MIEFKNPEIHPKAWGREVWIVNNDLYCGKILVIKEGKQFSLHFHMKKHETWFIRKGILLLEYFDLSIGENITKTLYPNDVIVIPPGNPHRLTAIHDSEIFEISTSHFESDSYRIALGDSQKSIELEPNTIEAQKPPR